MRSKYKYMTWEMSPDAVHHWGPYTITATLNCERGDYDWDLEYAAPDGSIDWIASCVTGDGESLKRAALKHSGVAVEDD